MNTILEAFKKLRVDEKWKSRHLWDYVYISHFCKSVYEVLSILESSKLESGRDDEKVIKNYISTSLDVYKIHERDPEKYPCGIVFDLRKFITNDLFDKYKITHYHDIAHKLNSGKKEIRLEWIAKIDEFSALIKFDAYTFGTAITIPIWLYEKLKNQINNIKTKLTYPIKIEDHTKEGYEEKIKVGINNNLYVSTKNLDHSIFIDPKHSDSEQDMSDEDALIYGDADEAEIRIKNKNGEGSVSLPFKRQAIEEIVLPPEFEKYLNEFNITPKEIILSKQKELIDYLIEHEGSRLLAKELKEKFSEKTVLFQLFFDFPPGKYIYQFI